MGLTSRFLLLTALLIGCDYTPVPSSARGNLICMWNGDRVFAGDLTLKGTGLISEIEGSWSFCNDRSVTCSFTVTVSTSTVAIP